MTGDKALTTVLINTDQTQFPYDAGGLFTAGVDWAGRLYVWGKLWGAGSSARALVPTLAPSPSWPASFRPERRAPPGRWARAHAAARALG